MRSPNTRRIERQTKSLTSVLTGEMQDRFAWNNKEREPRPIHPNYYIFAPFESARDTRIAIRGAYLLRLIGVRGKASEELTEIIEDEKIFAPNLVDNNGEQMTYGALKATTYLHFLQKDKLIEKTDSEIFIPSFNMRRVLSDYPEQPFTIFPLVRNPGIDFAADILDQYNLHDYGTTDMQIPPTE